MRYITLCARAQAAKMGEEERWLDVRETLKANMLLG
jgi:hypothetical protein